MKLKYKTVKIIESRDWDKLIQKTYGKPYCFQQQECYRRPGLTYFNVPCLAEDYENHTVTEKEYGVSFSAWLARPYTPYSLSTNMDLNILNEIIWHRHFYPDFLVLANDLLSKQLICPGEYGLRIF